MPIQEEHQTLATITLQNYFRLYDKLGGMTGTAKTEEKEFVEIYGLEVVPIPTNVDVARIDKNDLIFKTIEAKFNAVIADIKERNEKGQPVLVGTIAVETSELLSELLKRQGIPHEVLNAKEHAREAEIIIDAGRKGAVTIATNMAGRGVDIKIDDEVRGLGGLYVLGTERHEARRIDNQLRGRSGRQGDPGETRFYLSGQDDLVRLFAGDRLFNIMERFKLPDDQPMDQKILTNQIENAQKKVEEQNFVQRKNVLKYDDVMNVQRMVIYEQRRAVLEGQDLSEEIKEIWLPEVIADVVGAYTDERGRGRLGSRRARERDGGALRHRRDRRGARRARPRVDHRRVPRRRLGGLRRAREGDRGDAGRADARPRALHRAPGRRRPLARAPREHGLHARGHPPPRHGPEGSARRVPQRGPRDVPGAEPGDPRGGRRAPLPRADRAPGDANGQLPAAAGDERRTAPTSSSTRTPGGAYGLPAPNGDTGPTNGGGAPPVPVVKSENESIGRNDPCWCGSGKKYKRCHGALSGPAAPVPSPGHGSTRRHRSRSSSKRSGPSSTGSVITFDPARLTERRAALEAEMNTPGFWDDQARAQKTSTEHARVSKRHRDLRQARARVRGRTRSLRARSVDGRRDRRLRSRPLHRELERLEEAALFNGDYDTGDAVVTLQSGTGGTDAQDWTEMMLRMYERWGSERGFKIDLLEASPGEEAGLKSSTFTIEGENAYGVLKAERGKHRLVRLSPFDSAHRRQTSFATVIVAPLLPDDAEVEIDEGDLKIDTYRAQGAGGQHVNKTDSAVRITHLPTGIVVQCQNERSQSANKQTAMRVLKARLVEKLEEEREAKMAKERGGAADTGFGGEWIRSYVLHPYQQVKDARTGYETGNAQGVLDGNLDPVHPLLPPREGSKSARVAPSVML